MVFRGKLLIFFYIVASAPTNLNFNYNRFLSKNPADLPLYLFMVALKE